MADERNEAIYAPSPNMSEVDATDAYDWADAFIRAVRQVVG